MPDYLPEYHGRHYNRPKFGWDPPGLEDKAEEAPMPRAFSRAAFIGFSNAKLEKTAGLLESGGGQIGKILHNLLSIFTRKKHRAKKPEKLDKRFTVDVK